MVRRGVSLAQQIVVEILSEIEAGTMARDDGLLPSEAELSQRFQVSRATVREALSKLELAGVVIRRQGIGTYINPRVGSHPAAIEGWFDEASSFISLLRSANRAAEIEIVDAQIKPAGAVAPCLEIDPAHSVLVIERIFRSASVPTIHSIDIVPLQLIEPGRLGEALSLYRAAESPYQFLDQWCHRHVHHQQSETRAVAADERLARLLQCTLGAPLLRVEEVGYTVELQPVFYGLNHFRSDLISFRQIRHPALNVAPLPLGDGCACPG